MLSWWQFTGERGVEFSDGEYLYCRVVLEATDSRIAPPDGRFLYHSFGRYLYDDGSLDLFREGGEYFTSEGHKDLEVVIVDGVEIVDFGSYIRLSGVLLQQATIQDIEAMRAGWQVSVVGVGSLSG